MSYDVALRHHVQRSVMRDFSLLLADAGFDDDGDIAVVGEEGRPVFVRLVDDEHAAWARVWAFGAAGLKVGSKLLREVNEHNASAVAVRLLVTPHGQLIATAEVLAESIEPGELGRLAHLVSRAAVQVGGLVQIVYGQPADGRDLIDERPI